MFVQNQKRNYVKQQLDEVTKETKKRTMTHYVTAQ